jgi:hypothetical protein
MQWRINPSGRKGSYMYVVLQISPLLVFIAIVIRISDVDRYRYWSLSNAHLKTPVLFPLMSVELKAEAYIFVRLSSTNSNTMTASDGNLYRMSGPTCMPVCILNMFLASGLIAKLDDIPKNIPRTPSSANITGRKDNRSTFNAAVDNYDELKRMCGRFRVLVIGRSNAGKTTILRRIAQATDGRVSLLSIIIVEC